MIETDPKITTLEAPVGTHSNSALATQPTQSPLVIKSEEFRTHCLCTGRGHYIASERAESFHLYLGIPVVLTTSLVATSIFATLNHSTSLEWKIATGLVSFMASVLSALQTFFGFTETAEKHKKAGANYSRLRKDIEIFQLRFSTKDAPDAKSALGELTDFAQRLSDLALTSPNLDDRFYEQAKREAVTF